MKKKLMAFMAATVLAASCAVGFSGCGFLDDFLNGNPNPDTGEADEWLGENGSEIEHTHSYSGTRIVSPTCLKGGYTVHICDCGDTYNDSETDALGHDFVNYVCTRCSEVDASAPVESGLKFAPLTDNDQEDGEIIAYQVVGVEDDYKDAENLEIPETYEGKPVTAIGSQAFKNCKMKSVTIPDSVNKISDWAFYYCKDLESITIPEEVTVIEQYTFYLCNVLSTVNLGNKVTKIAKGAFSNCRALVSVNLPSTLKVISEQAFYECNSLQTLTLNEGLETIGAQAFEKCYTLSSLNIPASVTSIGTGITVGCIGLTTLTVSNGNADYYGKNNCLIKKDPYMDTLIAGCPASVIPDDDALSSIGPLAFAELLITEIEIPANISGIEYEAFRGCTELENVTFKSENTGYYYKGLQHIGHEAFAHTYSLGFVEFPASLNEIGPAAFYCSGIGGAVFHEGLRAIRERAFENTHFWSLELPESIRVVEWAFRNTPLHEIRICGEYANSWKVRLYSYYADYYEINIPEANFEPHEYDPNITVANEYIVNMVAVENLNDLVNLLHITPPEMELSNYRMIKVVPGEEGWYD